MAKRKRRWSQRVTETSDALTLKEGVFKKESPKAIASSLKRSAEHSRRRKTDPYRSAMSMLTFYINRAGKGLPKASQAKPSQAKPSQAKPSQAKLEKAKDELRALYGRKRSHG